MELWQFLRNWDERCSVLVFENTEFANANNGNDDINDGGVKVLRSFKPINRAVNVNFGLQGLIEVVIVIAKDLTDILEIMGSMT